MASNKFVIKCGNFAVLVDVHILPQGSSKDTSWFSDHEKENVCMLLEEVVASRVKQYLEAPKQRGQWKSMEHAPSGPLFLTDMQHFETRMPKIPFCLLLSLYVAANSLHITAYFMKRWVNLRCAVGRHYRDLRVFPDRFIVCISKLDCNPSDWTCDNDVLKEELSNGTSEYFTESAESKKAEISPNEQIKQGILKEIVKRTKMKKSNANKPQISKDSKVSVGSVELQTGNRKNDRQTSLSPQSEVTCRSPGLLKDCTNTIESNLELPVLKLENYVNQRQPDGVSSKQKPQSLEWLKSSHLRENLPCSSETALLDPKRSQKMTKTQTQQKTCAPEEKLEYFEKVCSEGTPLIPSNTEISKHNDGCLGPFLEEKTPLNSELFSKRDMTKAASGEESLRKNPSQPLTVRNNIAQTSQNEPSTTTENAMPPSYIELQPVPSEKLSQKRKKEVENGLRKLKLRRLKKS